MPKAVEPCRSRCRQMSRGFVVAQQQQWGIFSSNDPHKQGFLFAVEKWRREIGILMFQRLTEIGRSLILSRISLNKPEMMPLVAAKSRGGANIVKFIKTPAPLPYS